MAYRIAIGAGVLALVSSLGCQAPSDPAPRSLERTADATDALVGEERRLSWDHLHQLPRGLDQVAEGPSAVAVKPDGTVLVLDRLGGRILVAPAADGAAQTTPRELAQVPEHVEDIAVGPDGAVAAYSPLQARVWVFEDDGTPAGEVEVPRVFRDVVGVGLDGSRVVRLQTMHQETLRVGSPNAPLPLPVAMRTKREGAYQLADGRGVSAVARDGKATLHLVAQARGRERARTVATHALPGKVTAARVVGVSGQVACARTEEVTSTPTIAVSRRAVCVDMATGAMTLDVALPNKGTYLPRRELAVGAGKLAFMFPTPDGLVVRSFRVDGTAIQNKAPEQEASR